MRHCERASRAARRALFAAGVSLILGVDSAAAKELKSLGVSIGSRDFAFFVALSKGAEFEARRINPNAKITTVEHYWHVPTQSAQIDTFIAAGVDLIVLNPSDPNAIEPAIGRARKAGIPVVAADSRAAGADVTVETNNLQAGRIACEYLVEKMGGKGAMVILYGTFNTAVTDRTKGCNETAAKHPEIRILAQGELSIGSRDGGLFLGASMLAKFPQVDGVFAVNDASGLGMADAAKKGSRFNFPITAVDGSPEAVQALKDPRTPEFVGTASQDPFLMGRTAVQEGVKVLNGQKPDHDLVQMDTAMVTRDNVKDYKGWTSN